MGSWHRVGLLALSLLARPAQPLRAPATSLRGDPATQYSRSNQTALTAPNRRPISDLRRGPHPRHTMPRAQFLRQEPTAPFTVEDLVVSFRPCPARKHNLNPILNPNPIPSHMLTHAVLARVIRALAS